MKERSRGFTLIELLVVIAIIGLLSSIIFAALTRARISAEDARRRQNRNAVVTALNLYYNDNGHYPLLNGDPNQMYYRCLAPSGETCYLGRKEGDDTLITNLQPYLSTLPVNNAIPGTVAYNRIVYEYDPPNPPDPGGAWILWMQENPLRPSDCNGPTPNEDEVNGESIYWYCYDYLGH
jgi:prepilin-type N-terminal cleavage/methylation domain-containing protein